MTPARKKPAAERAVVRAYDNEWRDCLPLSDAELSAVEQDMGIALPNDLRALLLTCNGGRPEKSYFANDRMEFELGSLLAVQPPKSGRRASFVEEHRTLRENTGMPQSLVPFALDNGNDGAFCVDLESGEVVYWVQDSPPGARKDVAPSLSEFLSRLDTPPY